MSRKNQVGCHFRHRREYELSLVGTEVRQDQRLGITLFIPERDQIQVDFPRLVGQAGALPAKARLKLQ